MQIKLKQLVLALSLGIAVAATGLTGCQSSDHRGAGTYVDDRMVSSKVKGALDNAPVYKYPNVDVSSFNGTVQLNGFVLTTDQKVQAGAIASQVEGVKQIVNNLTIQPGQTTPTGRGASVVYPDTTTPPATHHY
jgi:hyperosmotically inducible periplasmic protein